MHREPIGIGCRREDSRRCCDLTPYSPNLVAERKNPMLKRILEFLTLKWLWDRRGGRRR
jgi:hypothetical protein